MSKVGMFLSKFLGVCLPALRGVFQLKTQEKIRYIPHGCCDKFLVGGSVEGNVLFWGVKVGWKRRLSH